MPLVRTRSALLAALIAPVLALTGCAAGTPAGSAADEDRTLTVYSGRSESLIGPLIEKFEKDSGISVEVRYGTSVQMAAQIVEEGERTPAQVFLSQEAGALGELANAKLLSPLPRDITGAVEAHYNPDDGSWVALTGRARVAVYDSQKLSADQVPADLNDLLDPSWRGRVGIAPTNASFQSFVTAMRVHDGEAAAEKWLTGLLANEPQIFEKNTPILEAVNTGALDVGLINHYYWAIAAAEAGGPTKMRAQLKFGKADTVSALVNVTGAGILTGSRNSADAQNSAEAEEFLRFLVSEKGQSYFVTENAEYSLVPGAASPEGIPSLTELRSPTIDSSKLADLKGTLTLLKKVGLV